MKIISERIKIFTVMLIVIGAYIIIGFMDEQLNKSTSGLTIYEVNK